MTQDANTASGAAIARALDEFEMRERGIPQAHIAAKVVAELRAALASATAQPVAEPTHAQIAAYLKATGAYVTNDASREAAIADAVEADRASRGQAPASVLHLVHSAFAEIAMAFPKAFALHKVGIADTAVREALAAPAPPPECETEAEKRAFAFGWFKALESERMKAESVQEDAARYRWLREHKALNNTHCWHFQGGPIIPGLLTLDAAIDAARKQGANHD